MPNTGITSTSTEYLQTLAKGLEVIKTFGPACPTQTLSEVAAAVGLSRAAARRFLLTLEALGYVERDNKRFRLAPQILDLGYTYLSAVPWRAHAQRVIDRLGSSLECACAVGVLDGDSVAYVAFAPGGVVANVIRTVGTKLPAFATAMGRAILAEAEAQCVNAALAPKTLQKFTPFTETDSTTLLSEIAKAREQGFAIVEQQLELGLYSIGVPIRDRSNRIIAGVSASARSYQMPKDELKERVLEPLLRAAQAISAGLAHL